MRNDPPARFTTFDLASALARVGGDSGLLADLARLFVDEARTLLPALRSAVEKRDAGAIERLAHNLRGSAATFSADPLQQSTLALELSARQSDMSEVDSLFSNVERSAEQFLGEVQDL